MQLVVDENLSRDLVKRLRQQGHRVLFIPDIQPGLKNGAVLNYANQQQALLTTADKTDFGELIFRLRQPCVGLLLVRLQLEMPQAQKVETVVNAVAEYGDQLLGKVTVLSDKQVRMRQLPAQPPPPLHEDSDLDLER